MLALHWSNFLHEIAVYLIGKNKSLNIQQENFYFALSLEINEFDICSFSLQSFPLRKFTRFSSSYFISKCNAMFNNFSVIIKQNTIVIITIKVYIIHIIKINIQSYYKLLMETQNCTWLIQNKHTIFPKQKKRIQEKHEGTNSRNTPFSPKIALLKSSIHYKSSSTLWIMYIMRTLKNDIKTLEHQNAR